MEMEKRKYMGRLEQYEKEIDLRTTMKRLSSK